jgi:hypothetical protein
MSTTIPNPAGYPDAIFPPPKKEGVPPMSDGTKRALGIDQPSSPAKLDPTPNPDPRKAPRP